MITLVTGGAGYIGSHMVIALLDRGDSVIVLDNLSTGLRGLVPSGVTFIKGDAGDGLLIKSLLQKHRVDAIIHFAGSVVVPESVSNPLEYYRNNTSITRNLIEACTSGGVDKFVFSSTAAVYGIPEENPVSERAATAPINPYGRSKLMIEWMLADSACALDFRYVALRYFNVAGADPNGRTGQSTPKATHLIKRACQVALGRSEKLQVFGTDFDTPDGTGVRDYIHVSDLVSAHLLALDYLVSGGAPLSANVGYGRGFSVLEVVEAVERCSGRKLSLERTSRRAGDPPILVSNPALLKEKFEWKPQYDDLDKIVSSALAWERRLNS